MTNKNGFSLDEVGVLFRHIHLLASSQMLTVELRYRPLNGGGWDRQWQSVKEELL